MKKASRKSARRPAPKARAATPVGSKLSPRTSGSMFPIVGIGASAGGLEAFTELLTALPLDTGMAFVLIQHLEAEHESMLTELLSKVTQMPVTEVRQGTRVEPNHVYVIPANADLEPRGRSAPGFHPQGWPPAATCRSIISSAPWPRLTDIWPLAWFCPAPLPTEPWDSRQFVPPAELLSRRNRNRPNSTACQRALFSPDASISCCPRIALPSELSQITLHPPAGLPNPEKDDPLVPAWDEDWMRLFKLLRDASGVDFTFYKKATISRRIARRMALKKSERLSEYLKHLQSNREELDELYRDLLIHVTSFFRDPEVFRALRNKILPQILARKPAGDPVRIWVPGCSTGEEAYSIAICLFESPARSRGDPPDSNLRQRYQRAGRRSGARRRVSQRRIEEGLEGARAAVLYRGGRELPDQIRHPRAVHFCPARPGQGPAILPHGSDQLP